jgi:hypothetical protein
MLQGGKAAAAKTPNGIRIRPGPVDEELRQAGCGVCYLTIAVSFGLTSAAWLIYSESF